MAKKRIEATVYGHVQGVYFRQATQQSARRFGLSGWVANEWDGTVQVIAEGEEQALEQLVDFLHDGPPSARVERVQANWLAATGEFDDFQVRWL
jgi:acylphosphatase